MPDHEERLQRARTALEGLSVGDAFGEQFFSHSPGGRTPPPPPWPFTDDTNMALSIYAILRQHRGIDPDRLARSFAEHYDPRRGYGMAMHGHLARIRDGAPWQEAASSLFGGEGSFGNGAAMRVAPVGAYFADDLEATVEHARRSAVVTHAHPEGITGAVAVAVAAAWAWRFREAGAAPARRDFIQRMLPHVPPGQVREGIARAGELPPDATVREAAGVLGNGSRISAQDTVPFVIWCAGGSLDSYEEALWTTVGGGGDLDTTCAIVGGIVATWAGVEAIPAAWRAAREPLPAWALEA